MFRRPQFFVRFFLQACFCAKESDPCIGAPAKRRSDDAPSKKIVQCRNLAASKRNQVTDDVDVGQLFEPESDNEVLFDDAVVTEACQDQVLQQMLVWKDGSTLPSPSAHIGDGGWTAWRLDVKNQQLLDSSKNVNKIWDFFPKKFCKSMDHFGKLYSPGPQNTECTN